MWRRLRGVGRPSGSAPPGWEWPVRISGRTPVGVDLTLRPLVLADGPAFHDVRRADAAWLEPWDATSPDPVAPPRAFGELVAHYEADATSGQALPLVIEVGGRLVGQVNAGTIVWGSFRSCTVGYWVSRSVAGRMVAPTAVALVGDHLLGRQGLHRIEVNIRPENHASLAVVRKLGFREEGRRPHYLHIAGDWREHVAFALTTEDLAGETFRQRLERLHLSGLGAVEASPSPRSAPSGPPVQSSQESLARHTDGGPRTRGRPPLPS
jgi:[ribosomal protein S5]-alanine N-acetyltransferase